MAEVEMAVESLGGGGELAKARQGQSGPARSAEWSAGSSGELRRADAAGQTGAARSGTALDASGRGKAGGGDRRGSPSPPGDRSAPAKRARASPRMDEYLRSLNEASQVMFESGALPLAQTGWTPCEQPAVPQHLDFGSGQVSGLAGPSRGRSKARLRIKLANFSVQEDINVVNSWLQISCDPGTNIGQKRESFWVRVVKQYNANRGIYPERTKRSIMCRFDIIKAEVRKFSRYMAEIFSRNPSGLSDADKTVEAAAQFAVIEKHNFTLMHCWNILKDEPKWLELKWRESKSKAPRDEEEPFREHTPHGSNSIDPDTDLSSPANSAGGPLGMDVVEQRPLGMDVAGERPLGMDAAGERPLGMDAAGERRLGMDAAGPERPPRMGAAGERPLGIGAAGEPPLGMDAAKEARKKSTATSALAASSKYASKLYDLTLEKFSYFKEIEVERRNRLAMIVSLEKETIAELREHRLRLIELDERRLDIEAERLEMKRKRDERSEDERILGINLDTCLPAQRLYYQALQEEILAKVKARRR
ncbi:hypothetical protein BS78_08G149900 [Paspalum vaginatum]|nr:hypothetical protein BS78_08G149900 [Paspalum vaginatum]